MKLLRFGEVGKEKPGILDNEEKIRDLSNFVDDFFGKNISISSLLKISEISVTDLPIIDHDVRIGPCLKDVPNFFCIGLNYKKHALETGLEIPKEPIIFSKATSCLSGPYDNIVLPNNSKKADWEIELGVIIGEDCENIHENDVMSIISGFTIVNDISEREYQLEKGGQWIKGKSARSFGPIGPYIITNDEIKNPDDLDLLLKVNNKICQQSSTSDMIFSINKIISYMSNFFKLRCGDIVSTGTPEGVGMGMRPQQFLKKGDQIISEIEGLGRQVQLVV